MLTKEDLQAIAELLKPMQDDIKEMKKDISELKEDVEVLKEDVEVLKEDTEITRFSTNQLIKWVEFYYGKEKPFPIDEDEIENQDKILKMID